MAQLLLAEADGRTEMCDPVQTYSVLFLFVFSSSHLGLTSAHLVSAYLLVGDLGA